MKWIILLSILLGLLFSGCDLKQRESLVQQKEAEIARREQELAVKEKSLQLKADELFYKEQQLKKSQEQDTSIQVAAGLANPALIGKWNASMTCTETTCTGWAIGDTRTETWHLSYQNERVIAKAMTGERLVRVYTGSYNNNLLELTEDVALSPAAPATKMVVRLTLLDSTTMEGQREIIRAAECRILYALHLDKL